MFSLLEQEAKTTPCTSTTKGSVRISWRSSSIWSEVYLTTRRNGKTTQTSLWVRSAGDQWVTCVCLLRKKKKNKKFLQSDVSTFLLSLEHPEQSLFISCIKLTTLRHVIVLSGFKCRRCGQQSRHDRCFGTCVTSARKEKRRILLRANFLTNHCSAGIEKVC